MAKKKNANLGKTLRKLREDCKLGIKSVAPQADVTYTYLSKIENGHKPPTKELLQKLCEIYKADKDQILAQFGSLPDDVKEIIQVNGKEVFELLRLHYRSEKGSRE